MPNSTSHLTVDWIYIVFLNLLVEKIKVELVFSL
jgi:hypothetical protein